MTCPHCANRTPSFLPGASEGAQVNYYRCDCCGCVWHRLKGDPSGPVHVVNFQPVKSKLPAAQQALKKNSA
jgi:hypothetical protein